LHWKSPTALSISCPQCSADLLRKRDENWGNVNITYDLTPR